MASGIIIAKAAGLSLADADGIAQGQSVGAGGGAITLNGSLIVGGEFNNPGWGHKVSVVSVGNDTGRTFHFTGEFHASNSVGGYQESMTVAGANAATATSSLYATKITAARCDTATASSFTVGIVADNTGVPVTLNSGSLYQFSYGGTFVGGTIQIKAYDNLAGEWIGYNQETGETASTKKNYEIPSGETVKAFLSGGSTTSAIYVQAKPINKQR